MWRRKSARSERAQSQQAWDSQHTCSKEKENAGLDVLATEALSMVVDENIVAEELKRGGRQRRSFRLKPDLK